jgi:hypothetical protein
LNKNLIFVKILKLNNMAEQVVTTVPQDEVSITSTPLTSTIETAIEPIVDEVLTFAEIQNRFPDQWVVVGNPVFEGVKVIEGIVFSNHPDKRVASVEASPRRNDFHTITLFFTGKMPPQRRIGLLRRLGNSVKITKINEPT